MVKLSQLKIDIVILYHIWSVKYIMFFINSSCKTQFYNGSQITFSVKKDYVDIIFKIRRGVYLIVSVYSLSNGRLLLSCAWDKFWNRLKNMHNREEVLAHLRKFCPLATNIFTNTIAPHFAFLDKEQQLGAVVMEMKAPVQTNNISDFLHKKVVERAIELMDYNLNLYTQLVEKCPFSQWKRDLEKLTI